MARVCNHSPQEAEAERSPPVPGQPRLQRPTLLREKWVCVRRRERRRERENTKPEGKEKLIHLSSTDAAVVSNCSLERHKGR